jgi:hypothetical protein
LGGARLASVVVLVIVALTFAASSAAAGHRAVTGRYSYEDQFVVSPGSPASCSFPVYGDMFGEFSFEVLLDAQGQPRQLINHEIWSGTLSANGNTVVEHGAQTDHFFANGDSANVGAIHDQALAGGLLIHDVGLLRWDANGLLAIEAGPHQGFDGDTAAIAALCAALT